jgi:hypothetical protein
MNGQSMNGQTIQRSDLLIEYVPKAKKYAKIAGYPPVFQKIWGGSSVGRALRSQCRGRGFESLSLHFKKYRQK